MAQSDSKKALLARRREAGQCVQCGVDAGGKSKCGPCAQKNAECRKVRSQKRREAGLCPNCKQPAKPGCYLCQDCITKASKCGLDHYYRNKAAGNCRYCGKDSGGKSRCAECQEKYATSQQKNYKRLKAEGRCTECRNPNDSPDHVFCTSCREKKRDINKKRWDELRLSALSAYGGPICAGCGCDEATILEIDHVDGGGNKHRAEIGQSNLYLWLKQNNYPPGFRILCPTCNKKAHRGLPLGKES